MKKVLLIDVPPLFRDFLKDKLELSGLGVEQATSDRDAWTKLMSLLPDLVIIDARDDIFSLEGFFDRKCADINVRKVPVILLGPIVDRGVLADLVRYGVIKYFTKPIKADNLLVIISRVLNVVVPIDPTECILDLHVNADLIFIEIARGLNRDKIALLKYRISEVIETLGMDSPSIALLMTDLTLTFIDGVNLEFLFDALVYDKKVDARRVKVLTRDVFTKDLLLGHLEYNGVQVADNLAQAFDSMVDTKEGGSASDTINNVILSADKLDFKGSVDLKFARDEGKLAPSKTQGSASAPVVAIIDNDKAVRDFIQAILIPLGYKCALFENGLDFLTKAQGNYVILVLDLALPGLSGLELLQKLHNARRNIPSLVYTAVTQRAAIMAALQLGAKGYLKKPQEASVLLKKIQDILMLK